MNPAPIVAACTSDPGLLRAIEEYGARWSDLGRLEWDLESDRIDNRFGPKMVGWFGPPYVPKQTEAREVKVMELRRELRQERARIAALCPIWDRLGGAPSIPVVP